MLEYGETQPNLSITRHAVQKLLHEAIVRSVTTCGLLCGQHGVIQTVCPFHSNQTTPLSLTDCEQSQESNPMIPLALYVSSTSHDENTDTLRSKVTHICSIDMDASAPLRTLPLALIRLDIKGRMEVVLLDKEDGTELPLLLQEDGQTIPHAV